MILFSKDAKRWAKYWRIRHGEYDMHQIREIKMRITAMMSETPISLQL